jgi:transposase
LRTGIPWRLLPTRQLGCGSPVTCWRRLRDWQRAGVWQRVHHQLLEQLGREGRLDWSRASLELHLDKAYDYPRCRRALRARDHASYRSARRRVQPAAGPPPLRGERSLAWLVGYRRLQVRHERRADILTAFLQLACALICRNSLKQAKA